MAEPVKILNANRLNGDLIVEFSDDTCAIYTAEDLLNLNKVRAPARVEAEAERAE